MEKVIALPRSYVFAIGVSGVLADKTGSAREKYNRASRAASTVFEIWRTTSKRAEPTLFQAIEHSPDAAQQIRQVLSQSSHPQFSSQVLLDRFEQFHLECTQIIPQASDALSRGDLIEFGNLTDQSQAGAEHALGNQIPETCELVRSARALGASAASAFGAGFGGAVWALIESDRVPAFLEKWQDTYHSQFPLRARASEFFACRPGPSTFRI